MKCVYCFLIFVSAVFNCAMQTIAYDAWAAGMPAYRLIAARGNVEVALFSLSLEELGEIRVSRV